MKLFGSRPRRNASGLTVIDERLTVRGDIETDGTVRVDGRVEGACHRVGTLIIGPRGSVVGDVHAAEVVVAGSITGNVSAAGRVEIERGASVRGDVRSSAVVIREGATINGQFCVDAEPKAVSGQDFEALELAPPTRTSHHAAA